MKFFDMPKPPWWRRILVRIPIFGRLFKVKVGPFRKVTFPAVNNEIPALDRSLITNSSVKDRGDDDIDEPWRRWRDRPGPR
jgi:hypothetical protein